MPSSPFCMRYGLSKIQMACVSLRSDVSMWHTAPLCGATAPHSKIDPTILLKDGSSAHTTLSCWTLPNSQFRIPDSESSLEYHLVRGLCQLVQVQHQEHSAPRIVSPRNHAVLFLKIVNAVVTPLEMTLVSTGSHSCPCAPPPQVA
jgi:hypothetical protein